MRRRVVSGLVCGACFGLMLGPPPVAFLVSILPPSVLIARGGDLYALYWASLGVTPVAAVAGAAIAYVTRPNQ